MGGSALKNTVTRRYAKAEYEALRDEVLRQLQTDFPAHQVAAIPAYRAKESFGDLDILLDTADLTMDWPGYLQQTFAPQEIVKNGPVISFDYQQFQIDLIASTPDDFAISLHYFAWNDLGNIIGRLLHKMGFKYGHDGLSLMFRDGDYQYGVLCISKDIEQILAFAGLDAERFLAGFDTLEDIFRFAASSPFFNKDIYLLENRNHAARSRDRKRQTYNALLKWLETQTELPAYPWESLKEQGGVQYKQVFVERAYEFFPACQPKIADMYARFQVWKSARAKFNGRLVSSWTGLQQQALGQFMQQLKTQAAVEFADFQQWLHDTPLPQIQAWVLAQQAK